jgi:hypothetical protein
MYVNKHRVFYCSKSKTIHGGTPVQTIMYISNTKGLCTLITHICRQRAPVGNALSSSGTSQLGMFDIQAPTKSKYYDHIVLSYLESRRCRYRSIIWFPTGALWRQCLYHLFKINLKKYQRTDYSNQDSIFYILLWSNDPRNFEIHLESVHSK